MSVIMRKTIPSLALALFFLGLHTGWAATRDEPRMTPLMEAAYRGDLAMVRALVEHGADINEKNAYGATALMMAAGAGLVTPQTYQGDTGVLKYLIQRGADVNAVGGNDTTALRYAVMHGNARSAQVLLDHGADINAGRGSGQTALAEAVLRNDLALVQLLLNRGAALNGYTDPNGRTPLMQAIAQYHPVPPGLNANTPTWELLTKAAPFMIQNKIIALLLKHGASVEGIDRSGETTLTLAAGQGRTSIVKQLLEHHAAINTPNRDGMTALMIAARDGNRPLVDYLIRAGADVTYRNRHGDTALRLALERHQAAVTSLLEDAEQH